MFCGYGPDRGVTRAGFSFARNAISLLSLGSLGWIQDLNFIVAGLLAAGYAPRIRRTVRGAPGGSRGAAACRRFAGWPRSWPECSARPGDRFPPGTPARGTGPYQRTQRRAQTPALVGRVQSARLPGGKPIPGSRSRHYLGPGAPGEAAYKHRAARQARGAPGALVHKPSTAQSQHEPCRPGRLQEVKG